VVPQERFGDAVFRLCPRFNYRSMREVNRILKSVRQSPDPERTRRELNLDLARKRAATEAAANAEAQERLERGDGEHGANQAEEFR